MYHAYEGPNGWYIARERPDGFHYQPADGGSLTEAQARQAAHRKNTRPRSPGQEQACAEADAG